MEGWPLCLSLGWGGQWEQAGSEIFRQNRPSLETCSSPHSLARLPRGVVAWLPGASGLYCVPPAIAQVGMQMLPSQSANYADCEMSFYLDLHSSLLLHRDSWSSETPNKEKGQTATIPMASMGLALRHEGGLLSQEQRCS